MVVVVDFVMVVAIGGVVDVVVAGIVEIVEELRWMRWDFLVGPVDVIVMVECVEVECVEVDLRLGGPSCLVSWWDEIVELEGVVGGWSQKPAGAGYWS